MNQDPASLSVTPASTLRNQQTLSEREPQMRYFKPWSTFLVGAAVGYFVVPKVRAAIGR